MVRAILLPFELFWHLLQITMKIGGRALAIGAGLLLLMIGGVLIVTVVGSPVGIALVALGGLFVARGLF